MFAASLKGYVTGGGTSPDLWIYGVADKFPAKIEGEDGVHWGQEKGLEYGTLMYSVKSFLQVDFEYGEGGAPFQVEFNGSLYGVEGFGCLPVSSIPALCFGDL